MNKKGYLVIIGLLWVALTGIAHADNVALTGTATQISTFYNWPASLAIDNNTDSANGSFTHTNMEYHAWWMVELQDTYLIDQIVIWNRTGVPDRLTNFNVSILDSSSLVVWDEDYYFTGGGYPNPSLSISLPANTTGEFVKVMLNGTNFLSLAEVQVYEGAPVPLPPGVWLFGTGLVGLIGLRRFRRS